MTWTKIGWSALSGAYVGIVFVLFMGPGDNWRWWIAVILINLVTKP